MINIEFPSYDRMKELPLDKSYSFWIFEIIGSVYVRLQYNEDGDRGLFLDVMNNGYCDQVYWYSTRGGGYINKFYEMTRENHRLLHVLAQEIYETVIKNMEEDWSGTWFD